MEAAGINRAEVEQRLGRYPVPPGKRSWIAWIEVAACLQLACTGGGESANDQCAVVGTGSTPILGLEAVGTILEVGAEATGDFKAGERVMALCSGGTYAEQVTLLSRPQALEDMLPLHVPPWCCAPLVPFLSA